MKYQNDKVTEMKITYIGGGSREWARFFMGDLALEPQLSGKVVLYDIDHEAAKQNATIGNKISAGKWAYEAVETLEEALVGADFVAISIQPGTFYEMESDVHLPERLSIYQSVGDSTGPGGMIRALRTIPVFAEFAENIKRYAPNAWVINYTNPMSLCTKVLYHVYPEIKAIGCCHEIFGTQELLKRMIESELGLTVNSRAEIKVNVLGINHFTWIDVASYKGIDLMPVYEKFVNENFDEGINTHHSENWEDSSYASLNRVKFDLFRKYGYIAAAGDRHLAEFVSSDIYLKNPEVVKNWTFGLTKVEERRVELKERQARSIRLFKGEEEIEFIETGEEGVRLIKALCGLDDFITNVNIPNASGQISNLSKDALVEVNAVFGRDMMRPIFAGEIPECILELTKPHLENHERILQAGLTCDKQLVIDAFLADPLVSDEIPVDEVITLIDDMIQNTMDYLPEGWKTHIKSNTNDGS